MAKTASNTGVNKGSHDPFDKYVVFRIPLAKPDLREVTVTSSAGIAASTCADCGHYHRDAIAHLCDCCATTQVVDKGLIRSRRTRLGILKQKERVSR